jgi:hypothetical protein
VSLVKNVATFQERCGTRFAPLPPTLAFLRNGKRDRAFSAGNSIEVTMLPDDEQVRRRAYEIWEREGRPEGRESEHWRKAVEELSAQRGNTDTQEVPATRVRGPAEVSQPASQPSGAGGSRSETTSGDSGNSARMPSPDPQTDPLGLAQPAAKAQRKRSGGRSTKRSRPDTAPSQGGNTKEPDRTR